jgi:uncharacterized membrane protein YqhA
MLKKILEKSRFAVVIAVLGSLAATLVLLGFGSFELIQIIGKAFFAEHELKALALKLIVVVDSYLLATVFFIIATGLYELFIDPAIVLPEWLEVKNLDDLKAKLIGVVVIVLAVSFLGYVSTWDGQQEILGLGVGIGAVIAALTYFLSQKK